MARRRYQKGRVVLRGKVNSVWVGRWREDVIGADGVTRRAFRILGSKSEIPKQRLALRRLEVLLSRVNAPDYRPGRMATLAEFAERWKETVLSPRKPSTQKAALSHLRSHILPQLGNVQLDALGQQAQQMSLSPNIAFSPLQAVEEPEELIAGVLTSRSAIRRRRPGESLLLQPLSASRYSPTCFTRAKARHP